MSTAPNPFSTRFIQPGAIAYHFFDDTTITSLAHSFLSVQSRRALIVGPHGSGKSTLVATLIDELKRMVPHTVIHSVRLSADRKAAIEMKECCRKWTDRSIVIIDGYEQLSRWTRWQSDRQIRRQQIRLLATAHEPIRGFEVLWKTYTDETLAKWVIEKLLDQSDQKRTEQLIASEAWKTSRQRNGENLRETLFDMYDWWHTENTIKTPPIPPNS